MSLRLRLDLLTSSSHFGNRFALHVVLFAADCTILDKVNVVSSIAMENTNFTPEEAIDS